MSMIDTNKILSDNGIDCLLVCCTNKYLTEYPELSENARYTLTGFSGSTGDALITKDEIYLFVDGRYHIQADLEAKPEVSVVKLQIGQSQDEEIKKIIKSFFFFFIHIKLKEIERACNFKGTEAYKKFISLKSNVNKIIFLNLYSDSSLFTFHNCSAF